jgi:deoxyribose-phosphate aldolase
MGLGSDVDVARLAIAMIDLTDLTGSGGADTSPDAVTALCRRAAEHGTAAVCVWSEHVARSAGLLAGTPVAVATVVNFPSGDESLATVLAATDAALADGADEIDVVLAHRAWLAGDDGDHGHPSAVLDGVRRLAGDRVVKVIVESGELPDAQTVRRAARFAIDHGADFVKTSTGKTPVSATPEAVAALLEAVKASGAAVGVKPSGGIRTAADARRYLELAADAMGDGWATPSTFRFGASALLDALLAVVSP